MRRMDRWLGVPICFLLTLVCRLAARRSPPSSTAPRNVLFIELAEMGSTVLACPAVHRLRTTYPDCRIHFLLFTHIKESVTVLGLIPDENVFTIDTSTIWTLARDTLRFMRTARRHRIDTTISLEMFTRAGAILGYLSGAERRLGFHAFTQPGLYAGRLLTHEVMYNPHLHTWQSFVALVDAVGESTTHVPMGKFPVSAERVVPRVTSDAASRQRMLDLLKRESPEVEGKRLIVVNPNASQLLTIRRWPLDRYAELVERLLRDPRNACVLTGLASEGKDTRFIADRVKSGRCVDLAGKTSLRALIDLFNVADLLVTNDSGPAHFAALTDIHVLVFFGPETPDLYTPLTDRCTPVYARYACSPCVSAYNQRRTDCRDNLCLQQFSVDHVHSLITGLLA
jgi:ADP-heptose:LPS heptosyltransferase